ncbi:HEAT repeat domain-containing protein [Spartinivicinus poritis]|uniref:HEAT repeat domain-containing protein n=1 Tax=Spartinivicinus poritis TaxID=2994640 RepID=A0ABT5U4J8_9GAMM|nr:HEAT repeat domain-containing protein [Spartinivicinus sp. A2-2]MDE1461285.1 HEAT repeat domain-containing protein [Spartinivicinus sp. A2-2]
MDVTGLINQTEQKLKKQLAISICISSLISGAIGYSLGQYNTVATDTQIAATESPSQEKPVVQDSPFTASPKPENQELAVDEEAASQQNEPGKSSEVVKARPEQVIIDLFAKLESLAGHPTPFAEGLQQQLEAKLLQEIQQNPAALKWAIAKFRSNLNEIPGQMLGVLLGTIQDPEVEELSLELTGSTVKSEKVAGLELMSRLGIFQEKQRDKILNVINSETDPEVLGAAIFAMQKHPTSPDDSQLIMDSFQSLSQHPNPELRRRSLIAIADWASSTDQLQPVVTALSDNSVDVRAGAAFALARSRFVNESATSALISTLQDNEEDWAVRELAWQALAEIPMSKEQYQAFKEFDDQRAVMFEAKDYSPGANTDVMAP